MNNFVGLGNRPIKIENGNPNAWQENSQNQLNRKYNIFYSDAIKLCKLTYR